MMAALFFCFAFLMPWVLGFAMVKPFMKQRRGYLPFAVGAGYILGWFVAILIFRIYSYFQRPFDIYEVAIIGCAIAFPLLFVSAKKLKVTEERLEKNISQWGYALFSIISLLVLYRLTLSAINLLTLPVFPWDGWLSWSAKAKVFYYYRSIPEFYNALMPFWSFAPDAMVPVNGGGHPYFISLVQSYMALARGEWDDSILGLPWLGLYVSVFFCIYGGVRYLGGSFLPALLTAYMTVSLPIFDIHSSLGGYADLWVGSAFLVLTILFVVALSYNEWRLLVLVTTFAVIVYFTKNNALMFVLSMLISVGYWYLFGKRMFVLSLLVLSVSLFFGKDWVNSELAEALSSMASHGFNVIIVYNPVANLAWQEWGVQDNWHYVFVASLGVIFGWGMPKNNEFSGFVLLIVAAFSSLLLMLGIALFTSKMYEGVFLGYFNRATLYFMPVLSLVSVSFYSLISKDNIHCS